MKKRLLSFALTLCMVLPLLCGTALAGYFGDNLTGAAKDFYEAMEDNPNALRNGNPVAVTFRSGTVTKDAVNQGMLAFHYDYPEIFWLEKSWSGTGYGSSWNITVPAAVSWKSGARSIAADEASIGRIAKTVAAEAKKLPSKEQQLRYAHDWLTKNNAYNSAALAANYSNVDATPWSAVSGLMSDLSPVCEGYSKSFKMICDELDIDCILVSGTGISTAGSGGHMWNYVRLGGNWYAVDVTWDDPIYTGGGDGPGVDTYFLVGSSTPDDWGQSFAATHKPNSDLPYPTLSTKSYAEVGDTPVKTYKITLNANGGTVSPTSLTVESGKTYFSDLPTPTRTGYIFDGWYTTMTGTTKITAATKATANRTIYAHWTEAAAAKTCKITLNANGGTVSPTSLTVESGKTYLSSLPTPTRAGYIFDGWYTTKTGTTKITAATKATANRTIYAHWTEAPAVKTYKITLNANGGTVSPTFLTVESGKTYLNDLPTPTRTGYKFDGWYTTKTGATKITAATKATANRTIYAHWTAEEADEVNTTHTVRFDANGGMVHQKYKAVVTSSKYRDLPTPTRIGYHFTGWYTARTGGTKITEKTRVSLTGDQTLYAHWSTSAVKVVDMDNGSWDITVPAHYTLTFYDSPETAAKLGHIDPLATEYTIRCTRHAELSNGTERYYGRFAGKDFWFQFTCEMDED